MYRSTISFVTLTLCALYTRGESSDQHLLPSVVLRDDILFDISWPGPPDVGSVLPKRNSMDSDIQSSSNDQVLGEDRDRTEGVNELRVNEKPKGEGKACSELLSEVDHQEMEYMDMQTSNNERYRCILPEINFGGVAEVWL